MRISDWSSDVCSSDLETVVAGLRTENTAATIEQWRFDAPCPGTTGSLLFMELTGRTGNLITLLGFMRSLALVSKVLLHIQINRMVIGFDTEYQIGRASCRERVGQNVWI